MDTTVLERPVGREMENTASRDEENVFVTLTVAEQLCGVPVVVEQGGELYAFLVDQVSEVLSLPASQFECNPPTLPPAWAAHSAGIYRLQGRLMVVLDVARLLALAVDG
jgi:purine-binding chemotaxis protein CheW